MILAPDDIQTDSHVCIHSIRHFRRRRNQRVEMPRTDIPSDLAIPSGVPLRVMAMSLPFVLSTVLEPGGDESGPAIIDLRTIHLTPVSDDYIDAL